MTVLHPTMRILADGDEAYTGLLNRNFMHGSVSVSLVENVHATLFDQPLPPSFGLISYVAAISVPEDELLNGEAVLRTLDVNVHLAILPEDQTDPAFKAWALKTVNHQLFECCRGQSLALLQCNEFPLWLNSRWMEIMDSLDKATPVRKTLTLREWRAKHYPEQSFLGRLIDRVFSGFGL